MNDIVLDNISKSFGEKKVLEDFSCVFKGGEITCVYGASGKGKTTLLNVIAGLTKPDGGEIAGTPEKISFVFQEDRLCEDFSAVSNVRLVCPKMPKKEIITHLGELGLAEAAGKPVKEYSGGMKRRVAIARAIAYGADLILLDEPFKGLDETLKTDVINYIKRHTEGKTVICVTHDRSDSTLLGGNILDLDLK